MEELVTQLLAEHFISAREAAEIRSGLCAPQGVAIKPSRWFYWNVHLDGLEAGHDGSVNRKGVFREAVAGIQLAKRIGFQVATNTTVYKATEMTEIDDLFTFLASLGVDGHTLSPGYHFEDAARAMGQSWLNSITVRVKEGYDSALAEQQLERLLTLRHGKKDFFTWNMDGLLKTAEKTTRTLQMFLTLVAVISLVVGGIGVMNIMLVSVTERTREIGIRMAVGARASDVLQQFLIEAVLVCLVGGAMGIALSMMIAFMLQLFLPGWEIGFSPVAILTAFLCSTVTGILFGWLPARNAARLDPVDALARE